MENIEKISIEFSDMINRFSADFDYKYDNLNQRDKEDFNHENLESWETSIFMLNRIEKVKKDISITQRLIDIRKNLLNMGFSLPKASYMVLHLNLDINIEREKKYYELNIEEIGNISSENIKKEKIEFDLIKSLIKMKFDDIDFTRIDSYFDAVNNARLLNKLNSIKVDKTKKEITLKNFFLNTVNDKIINDIQTTFWDYTGKRMAILIYLLQKKFKLIEIIQSSNTHSRKHFVNHLKKDSSFNKMNAINKYFDPFTEELKFSTTNTIDPDYLQILTKLIEITQNGVV